MFDDNGIKIMDIEKDTLVISSSNIFFKLNMKDRDIKVIKLYGSFKEFGDLLGLSFVKDTFSVNIEFKNEIKYAGFIDWLVRNTLWDILEYNKIDEKELKSRSIRVIHSSSLVKNPG